jgi:hypothetical protein
MPSCFLLAADLILICLPKAVNHSGRLRGRAQDEDVFADRLCVVLTTGSRTFPFHAGGSCGRFCGRVPRAQAPHSGGAAGQGPAGGHDRGRSERRPGPQEGQRRDRGRGCDSRGQGRG